MKLFKLILMLVALTSCTKAPQIEEVNLSQYFMGLNGTAVFYNPSTEQYKVYNQALSKQRSSPCSTFKIMSSYISLAETLVSLENSEKIWNGTTYWLPDWNKNMTLPEAIQVSCVWYYRRLIDDIGPSKIQTYLSKYAYGNEDISDWDGKLNDNEKKRDLNGFWIESSLKISPFEQVQFLSKVFAEPNQAAVDLKKIMPVIDFPIKIYGKTGMGLKDDKIADAWFVGFYEVNNVPIYFAVRLADGASDKVKDYRRLASRYARQIAIDIINNANLF